jgi:hypothetical protein
LRGKRIRGSQREEDHGTDREKAPSKASVIGFEIKTARANESMYGASFEKKIFRQSFQITCALKADSCNL